MKIIYTIDLQEFPLENRKISKKNKQTGIIYFESKKMPPFLIPGMCIYFPGIEGYLSVRDNIGVCWFENQDKMVIEMSPDGFVDQKTGELPEDFWISLLDSGWKITTETFEEL